MTTNNNLTNWTAVNGHKISHYPTDFVNDETHNNHLGRYWTSSVNDYKINHYSIEQQVHNLMNNRYYEWSQGMSLSNGAPTQQVARPNRWSGLIEQLKYPHVDDKASDFITSNEANWLCHPVWLNVGKHQRKAGDFVYWKDFASIPIMIISIKKWNGRIKTL